MLLLVKMETYWDKLYCYYLINMYPKEEISEGILSIQETIIQIGISKNENIRVCNLLTNLSLDVQKVTTLFKHAERLHRIKESIGEIGDELLEQLYELTNLLDNKVITKKSRDDDRLVTDGDYRKYQRKVKENHSPK